MNALRIASCFFLVSASLILGSNPPAGADLLDRVEKLDSFTRITKVPVILAAKYAVLCGGFGGTAGDHSTLIGRGPSDDVGDHGALINHSGATIHVYATSEGASLIKESKFPLPEGTIVLKEKFAEPNSKSPELYTGMRKREKGYNPKAGDWEFFVLSADRKAITARGRIDSCADCHQQRAKTDFLMMNYASFIEIQPKK